MRSVALTATLLSFALVGPAVAQTPLVVNVTPGTASVGTPVPPGVGVPVVIDGVTYDRVPARVLFITGPRYTEPSGVRIGRGSVIPDWLAADPMRDVSIRRLRPGRLSTATSSRRITRSSFSSLARAGSRASSVEPGKDHQLSTWEGARGPRETRRHVFDKPPRYDCSGASGQAFSAQEVWRDEVNGADRVACADERPVLREQRQASSPPQKAYRTPQ